LYGFDYFLIAHAVHLGSAQELRRAMARSAA
jgi:hypothetical protein